MIRVNNWRKELPTQCDFIYYIPVVDFITEDQLIQDSNHFNRKVYYKVFKIIEAKIVTASS
jgi:hypothetical protein